MKFKYLNSLAPFCGLIAISAHGQSIWNDGAEDSVWGSPANWSGGIPSAGSSVQFQTQPTDNEVGLTTNVTISSLQFNSSLTAPMTLFAFGSQTLSITGNLTNLDTDTHRINAPFITGGNATWAGPGAVRFGNNVTIGANQINLTGPIQFAGSNLNFTINAAGSGNYGAFTGAGAITFATPTAINITVANSYLNTAIAGDVFDLSGTNFTGASFNSSAFTSANQLSGGLTWNTSQFISQGLLTVVSAVPEPSTAAALAGLGALGFIGARRRKRVIAA